MRLKMRWTLTVLAGLYSIVLFAQSDPNDIVSGRVVSGPNSAPVAGISVHLVATCGWGTSRGAAGLDMKQTTNEKGEYLFRNVTPGSTCFSVKVFNAKGKLLAESAPWAMASYNRCTVPDINIKPVKKTDTTAKPEIASCRV